MNEKQPRTSQSEDQPRAPKHPEAERVPTPSPAIYVASLADYNNGVLHGAWIDAARDPEDIHADIKAMLDQSCEPNAEEWAIHDYDHFGRCRLGEYDAIERVARIAQGIAEHGYAFSAWADLCDDDPDRLDDFANAYFGHYTSVQAYVDEMADDLGYMEELAKLPESLRPYLHFDTAALARDMELSGDMQTVDDPAGGVWIFQTSQ
jgi:antirestriction protein